MTDSPLMKVVIDCSTAGTPDPALAAQLEAEALDFLRNGEPDKAAVVMRDAAAALALSVVETSTVVPLNDEEIAQHAIDQAAAAVAAATAVETAWGALRTQRDAWLLATDWMFLDQLPTDTPAPTLKAIAANKAGWTSFRQALRDLTADQTIDPSDVVWPTPPDSPAITLS